MNHVEHLECLRKTAYLPETLTESRTNPKAFTRKRSMSFADSLCFQLDMRKTALQSRLNTFFESKGGDPISQQAFSKLRANYDHSPFVKMHRNAVKKEYDGDYETKKWNGFHIFAVDGSTLQLPRTEEMRQEFGTRGRGHVCPCAGISVLFDVLHGWAVDAIFEQGNRSERTACVRHLEFLRDKLPNAASQSIVLLDRGYPSFDLFEKMKQKDLYFLARCSKASFSAVVNAPMGSSVVFIENRKKGKEPIKLRVFKFALPSGEIEILASNLFDLPEHLFPELYGQRWGIETAFHRLKRVLCVENFSGRTPNSVRQDFWASVVLLNAVATFQNDADAQVSERQNSKHIKHFSRARTSHIVVTLRDRFVFASLCADPLTPTKDFDGIIREMARCISPIRPGRSFPRVAHPTLHKDFNLNLKSHL
jgi:hypothetical protein